MEQQTEWTAAQRSDFERVELAEDIIDRIADRAVDRARGARLDDIPFADEPHQTFSRDWAERMLRELFTHHRMVFGECARGVFAEVRKDKPGPKVRP